jgi:hypothetical protein
MFDQFPDLPFMLDPETTGHLLRIRCWSKMSREIVILVIVPPTSYRVSSQKQQRKPWWQTHDNVTKKRLVENARHSFETW